VSRSRLRGGCARWAVERIDHGPLTARDQVPVDVDRDLDRRVPELIANVGQAHAAADQEAGVRMAQGVRRPRAKPRAAQEAMPEALQPVSAGRGPRIGCWKEPVLSTERATRDDGLRRSQLDPAPERMLEVLTGAPAKWGSDDSAGSRSSAGLPGLSRPAPPGPPATRPGPSS